MPFVGDKPNSTNSQFGDLIRQGGCFVDKSLLIQDFINDPNDSTLLLRPRRFGKSLLLRMLQHFFSKQVLGQPTNKLFKDLAIFTACNGQYMENYQGKYPVILLSLKNVSSDSPGNFYESIKAVMEELYRYHGSLLEEESFPDHYRTKFKKYLSGTATNEELKSSLKFLSECLFKFYQQKVVILIDEYDSPLANAYSGDCLEEVTLFSRDFFSSALKDNEYLYKSLMTGILRVSKNNMLSGLNNLKVRTMFDKLYAPHFGFTEKEVEELLEKFGFSKHLKSVKKYYNGYRIGSVFVYNPFAIISYLDNGQLEPYWIHTSNDVLIRSSLIQAPKQEQEKFKRLLEGEVVVAEINPNLKYDELIENPSSLWTLLFFCGYLTFNDRTIVDTHYQCELTIPNKEIFAQYKVVFIDWLKSKVKGDYQSFLSQLTTGDVDGFAQNLRGFLLSCTSGHDFQAEADYHCFVLGLLCSLYDTHFILSNKEYAAGRPDCIIIPKQETGKKLAVVLEFKHLHPSKKREKDVEEFERFAQNAAHEAIMQIKMRGYEYALSQHQHVNQLLRLGIAFYQRTPVTAYQFGTTDTKAIFSSTTDIKYIKSHYHEDPYFQGLVGEDEAGPAREKEADDAIDDTHGQAASAIAPSSGQGRAGHFKARRVIESSSDEEDENPGNNSSKRPS